MRHRIIFLRPARSHLREVAQWWRENRAIPELLERELDAALGLLGARQRTGVVGLGAERTLAEQTLSARELAQDLAVVGKPPLCIL
jgi:hypothetical protein